MYLKLGYLSWWPSRNVIFDNMPQKYKYDFPTSMAIIDCTEIKTETPSSLKAQSQCFSDYKSSTTLKSLVCIDPRGSIMFVSSLFSGSISDNDICEKSGFLNFLKSLNERGFLVDNDAIMADKGFRIEKQLSEIGLKLNIPPFSTQVSQISASDVALTRKIAKY